MIKMTNISDKQLKMFDKIYDISVMILEEQNIIDVLAGYCESVIDNSEEVIKISVLLDIVKQKNKELFDKTDNLICGLKKFL